MRVVVDPDATECQKENLAAILGKGTPRERIETLVNRLGWKTKVSDEAEGVNIELQQVLLTDEMPKQLWECLGIFGVATLEVLGTHNMRAKITRNILEHIATKDSKNPVKVRLYLRSC